MSEKNSDIIKKKYDVNNMDVRRKRVFNYYFDIINAVNLSYIEIEKISNLFELYLKRGNIVSRYINGENIDEITLKYSVELLTEQIIKNNFSDIECSKKIIKK